MISKLLPFLPGANELKEASYHHYYMHQYGGGSFIGMGFL